MGLILKIAVRNLFRHMGRSLIIGVILFTGAFFIAIGNSVIVGMEKGLEENLVDRFSGDISVVSKKQKNSDVLFGTKPMKVIENYEKVETILKTMKDIERFLPVTRGLALSLNLSNANQTHSHPLICLLIGTDIEKYWQMFRENIVIVEGAILKPGEKGILINQLEREDIYDMEGVWLLPENYSPVKENLTPEALDGLDGLRTRDDLVLVGMGDGNTALDVRVKVKGIYRFKQLNMLLKNVNITDLETFRECFEYVTSRDNIKGLAEEYRHLLDIDENELDKLFSEGSLLSSGNINDMVEKKDKRIHAKGHSSDTDKGAYNMVLVKLIETAAPEKVVEKLNLSFEAADVDGKAVIWKDAIGMAAELALLFKVALYIFVVLIIFVSTIIIVNTLSMAATERSIEIGLMRALGAQKGFTARMFAVETCLLSLFFGSLGLTLGFAVSVFLATLKYPASNEMIAMVFGGDTFRPLIDLPCILTAMIELGATTLAAGVYPVFLSRRITPLDAVTRE